MLVYSEFTVCELLHRPTIKHSSSTIHEAVVYI